MYKGENVHCSGDVHFVLWLRFMDYTRAGPYRFCSTIKFFVDDLQNHKTGDVLSAKFLSAYSNNFT